MNGILNINKPAAWTSHDVIAWVRKVLREKRVGHSGTLDPLATGVLLVCVGQATRVAEYLMASTKVYRAEAQLGTTTDTYDADGTIVATAAVPPLTEADLVAALRPFTGEILQAPPAYSAIKQDGVPLHRRARRGEEVRPAPRPVRIHSIELLTWKPPRLTLEITCDPGTYIRSLTHDLGQALGCGAVLTQLIRTRSGHFTVADAVSLDALAAAARAGDLARYLHPLTAALDGLTPIPLDPSDERRLRNGQAIGGPAATANPDGYAVTAAGRVVAILRHDPRTSTWRPVKVFADDD